MTIYYICPDYPRPSGGVRVIYRHVECLERSGITARVLHEVHPFRPTWFHSAAKVSWLSERPRFAEGDIAVVPENFPLVKAHRAGVEPTVAFVQNPYYLFYEQRRLGDWQSKGVKTLFASSRATSLVLARGGIEVDAIVPCAVDRELFQGASKRRQIALMPRKRPKEARTIQSFLEHKLLSNEGAPAWAVIDDVHEVEAARLLADSAIFLCLASLEGLGLPALEAMAAGCIVVGFPGLGGGEYATSRNGLWCGDGDVIRCVSELSFALSILGTSTADRLIEDGRRTACLYGYDAFRQELLAFWGKFRC